jgi:CDP-paratose 2-epimerase
VKLLITGICGFAGSTLARHLHEHQPGLEIFGVDNFIRAGSELNRRPLQAAGLKVLHADLRCAEVLGSMSFAVLLRGGAGRGMIVRGISRGSAAREHKEHRAV